MSHRRFQFRPQLEAFENRLCPSGSTVVLPISAFLAQQGHDNVFAPPVKDQQAWSNSTFDPGATSTDPTRLLLTDYAGQAAQYLLQNGINLHTTITGFVTETPIKNGSDPAGHQLMEVSLNLEATKALTWVVNIAGIRPQTTQYYARHQYGAARAGLPRPGPGWAPGTDARAVQRAFPDDLAGERRCPLPDLAQLNEDFASSHPPVSPMSGSTSNHGGRAPWTPGRPRAIRAKRRSSPPGRSPI